MRYLIIVISLLLSSVVFAQTFSVENRAMGGILTQEVNDPAISALNKKHFSFVFLSIDMKASVSEGFKIYSWVKDFDDFKDSFNSIFDILIKKDKLVELLSRATRQFELYNHIDLLSFIFGNDRFGKIHISLYVDDVAGIKTNVPDVNNFKIVGDKIDIGAPTDLISGYSRNDGGVRIGYGRWFKLPYGAKISGGITNRTYYRVNVPMTVVRVNQMIGGTDDINIPEFKYDTGIGTAFDLSSVFDANDRLFALRLLLGVDNVFNKTFYDGYPTRDPLYIRIGALIHPLHKLNLDGFGVGSDLHFYESGVPSIHFGSYWEIGNRWINIVPRIGGIIKDRDLFGNERDVFTCGLTTMLGVISLGGVFEYRGGDNYDVGVRFGLGN